MPEDIESPTEKLEEHIHEAAERGETWLRWCALLSCIFAVMAALSGLIASGYANSAMIEQIRASDQWGFYQAKSIKQLVVESESNILKQGAQADAANAANEKAERYKKEAEAIHGEAEQLAEASARHMEKHEITARAVTCFQVAIAVIAIVVLTKRRRFLLLSMGLGIAGFVFLGLGI